MKKTLFIFSIFLLFIFGNYLFLAKNAVGAIIDFEDFAYPGNDRLSISDQYLGTYGVEFYLGNGGTPNLEQVGDLPDDDFVGFWNDAKAAADIEAVGFEGGLGNYYLRLNGLRLSLIHISEPTRPRLVSRIPSYA